MHQRGENQTSIRSKNSSGMILLKNTLKLPLDGLLQVFGDNLYLLPRGLPDLSKVKIARNGLHLGIFKKKRFEPSFALGIALTSDEVVSSIELTQEQFAQYASGNVVTLDQIRSKTVGISF